MWKLIFACLTSYRLISHHPQTSTAEQESVQTPELHLALSFNEIKNICNIYTVDKHSKITSTKCRFG